MERGAPTEDKLLGAVDGLSAHLAARQHTDGLTTSD
jgi:hypothetical protein